MHYPKKGPCWQQVRFVDQDLNQGMRYEAQIYFNGQVLTRVACWHDLFNYYSWLLWPQSKWALTARTVQGYLKYPQHHFKTRIGAQNHLARFDECGLVIVAPAEILTLIQNHQWQKLFVEQRETFASKVKVHIFGHALYEKLLQPYVGLTGFAILLEEGNADLDTTIASIINDKQSFNQKSFLQPFPLLGVPGVYPDNEKVSFYDNKDYFRPKRSVVTTSW